MQKSLFKLLVMFSLMVLPNTSQAQEMSTLGKTFWVSFMENFGGTGGCSDNTSPQLKVVISCTKATTGSVKNFITNVSMPFSIGTGGGVDTVLVPVSQGYVTGSEATSTRNRGLLITANDTISVSAQNTKQYSCDATLVYPIEALGTDYRVFSHISDQAGNNACYRSTFLIVATENGTTVDITPTVATTGGKAANTLFSITLDKGETYMVKSSTNKNDLSGTLIQAKDCKKIAVFSGNNRASVLYGANNSCGSSYDQLWEQLMPINTWGKKFIVVPTIYQKGKQRKADMIRVVSSLNSTVVRVNGRAKVLSTAGMSDTFFIPSNALIIANKPIGVCQYGLSEDCDKAGFAGTDTDPMMMWVPPTEQSLKNLSFVCENAQTINKFFLNVIVKTSTRSTFRLDGLTPSATWTLVDKDTSYSYIQQDGLTLGKHRIYSPYGFSAVLYAYGDHGSYGFNAGSSIKPLSFYSVVNGKSSADFEPDSLFYTVCEDASITFDGSGSTTTGVTWKWLAKDNTGTLLSGFPKTSKSFTYTFKDTGRYKVTLIAQRPVNGVCNGQTTIDDSIPSEVRVYKKPDIRLLKDTTICLGNSLYLTSTTDGDTNYTFTPNIWLNCNKCYKPLAKPLRDTSYYVSATYKGCTPSRDTVNIFLRDSFFIGISNDTTICRGTSTDISATAVGGLSSSLVVNWDHGLGGGLNKTVNPKTTTTYRAILTDGCTKDGNGNLYADTAYVTVTVRDSLKITMPKDTLVCEGNVVDLTASITGGVPGMQVVTWDQGLGNGLSKQVTLGSTDVTYKAVLTDGCTVPNDSGYVTVKVRPGIKIDTVMFMTPVCKNQPFKINVRASGGDSTGYKFKLYNTTTGNVLIDSAFSKTYPQFTLTIPDDQSYNLKMNQGCNAQQVSKRFSIKIKTGLNISNPTPIDTICNLRTFNLKINGTSADNLPIKFVLKRKNGAAWVAIDSTINASVGSFTVNPPSSPSDYLIIGNDFCSRTDSTTFKLFIRNPISLSPLVGDELCRGEAITLTANATGGKAQAIKYRWYDVASNATLGSNKSITYTPTQSLDIGVFVNDGCSDSLNSTTRLWLAPLVTDSVLCTNLDGCEPFSTQFSYPKTQAQNPLNPSFTWKWYFDGVNSINTPSTGGATHADIPKNYPVAGAYNAKVNMVLNNGKICFSKTQDVNAWVQAVADFTYLPRVIDIIEPEVSFTNSSTGADYYQWKFGDGGTDNIQHPKHIYGDTGLYVVTMVAGTVHGCNDTTMQKLRVLDIYRIFIPNAFSPNKDDINTFWEPKFTSTLSIELTIFNRWGEKVYYSNDNTGRWDGTYNGVECEQEVYYYHLKIRDNRKKWHYYNGMINLLR